MSIPGTFVWSTTSTYRIVVQCWLAAIILTGLDPTIQPLCNARTIWLDLGACRDGGTDSSTSVDKINQAHDITIAASHTHHTRTQHHRRAAWPTKIYTCPPSQPTPCSFRDKRGFWSMRRNLDDHAAPNGPNPGGDEFSE